MSRARRRMLPAAVAAALVLLGTAAGVAWAAFTAVAQNGPSTFSVVDDTAAPSLSGVTVAKAAGGPAGVIRQGGDYYVYADASDAVSGVAQVTADTSAFDAGVTAAALSTAGGPWTVDGQTYAYRSALLTADSPLPTGSVHTYTVRATDNAGNANAPTFTATVETYAAVVAATGGLVAHWRLHEATVGDDAFTGPAGSSLQTHSGSVGASWTKLAGTDNAVITAAGRIRTSDGTSRYWASGAPPTADYTVEADVYAASVSSGDVAGVLGRVDTASAGGTWYAAAYDVSAGRWVLSRRVAGTTTTLGSSTSRAPTDGSTRRLSLDMRGTTVRLLVDGVELVSTTDSAIATAGRAGVTLGGAAGGGSGLLGGILGVLGGILGGANPDDATLQLDNFRVAPALRDSTGASSGAYLRGPTLQRPGALVGDTDTAAAFDGANNFAAIPDAAALDLADGPFTLEAWLKRSNVSTARQTLLQKGTGAYHWALDNNRLALLKEGSGTVVQSTTTLTDTTAFHHVAVTRSATGATKLYIDGADVTGTVTAHALTDTATALFIGGQPAGVTPLGGTLDEVAVYRAELTPAQILDHRRAGSGTG